MDKKFYIWEGIYSNFDEVPSCNDGFESNRWIDTNYQKTKSIIENYNSEEFVNENAKYNSSILSVVIALTLALQAKIKVLDFGGGMGITYIQTKAALPDESPLEFTVVEGEKNCIKARRLFGDDIGIKFCNTLPENESFDIIHISSSLQYIEDWKGLVKTLCEKYNTSYFVFNDLPAGDIKNTFATYQNYYESKIPYWFFKIDDVVELLAESGYQLLHKANFAASILGNQERVPQDNFPKEYQIGYAKNLIFQKVK